MATNDDLVRAMIALQDSIAGLTRVGESQQRDAQRTERGADTGKSARAASAQTSTARKTATRLAGLATAAGAAAVGAVGLGGVQSVLQGGSFAGGAANAALALGGKLVGGGLGVAAAGQTAAVSGTVAALGDAAGAGAEFSDEQIGFLADINRVTGERRESFRQRVSNVANTQLEQQIGATGTGAMALGALEGLKGAAKNVVQAVESGLGIDTQK